MTEPLIEDVDEKEYHEGIQAEIEEDAPLGESEGEEKLIPDLMDVIMEDGDKDAVELKETPAEEEKEVKANEKEPALVEEEDTTDYKKHSEGLRGALTKERAEKNVLRKELEEERKRGRDVNERVKALENPPKPVPDQYEDPEGYQQHLEAERDTYKTQLAEVKTNTQEQHQQQADAQALTDYWEQSKTDFVAEHPDYDDAEKFIFDKHIKTLVDQGHKESVAKNDFDVRIYNQLTLMNKDDGNIAQWVYAQAIQGGYKQGNGEVEEENTATDDDITIAKGQAASKALGKSDGAGKPGKNDAGDIGKLEGDEYTEAYLDHMAKLTGIPRDIMY